MPSRRAHTNSHHGCVQCKAGRVKCDEQQPICGRCRRRGHGCTYRHLVSSRGAFEQRDADRERHLGVPDTRWEQSPPEVETVVVRRSPPRLGATGLPSSDPEDHFLIHHYFGHLLSMPTSGSVDKWDILPVFRQAVTRHVLADSYLHQAVLAFSAIHLASVSSSKVRSPSSPYLVAALHHKASTLALFQPILASSLTPTRCESALAAAGLLVAFEFALPMADSTASVSGARVKELSRVVGLFQGAVALFRLGWQSLHAGEGSTALQIRKSVLVSFMNEQTWPEAEDSVDRVMEMVKGLRDDHKQRRDVLVQAGSKLQLALRRVAASRGSFHIACMWLGMVESPFIDLLSANDTLALVLLAHWAVCLKDVDTEHAWWIRGWPEMMIKAVVGSIDESCAGLVDWPLRELEKFEQLNSLCKLS